MSATPVGDANIPSPGRFRDWWHLSTRFFRAMWPGPPRASNVAWVRGVLTPEEFALWSSQPAHDRRHTIGVAHRVVAYLAGTPFAHDTRWPAAALLHDIGKVQARLSVYGRVIATIAARLTKRQMIDAWAASRGFTRRVGLYLQHGAIGADMLEIAGARPEVTAWAGAHHDRTAWSGVDIPAEVIRALVLSDAD
jgi:hypothetical protein